MASADQADAALAKALAALQPITDAGSGRSLLELQWIQQVRVQNNRVVFRLALPGYANAQRERIASDARGASSICTSLMPASSSRAPRASLAMRSRWALA